MSEIIVKETNLNTKMKRLLLVFVSVLVSISGQAQKTADIGIWGGTATVWGDMDDNTPFQTLNLNFGAYFRYNFNARVGLRAMFLTGNMSNSGTVESVDWDFDKNVQDLTLQVEINYLKYILGVKNLRFSPYVTLGIGVSYFNYNFQPDSILKFNPSYPEIVELTSKYESSEVVATIPFGIGFKYTIGKRLGIGVEYQMRKYLSDKLDDLDDPLSYKDGEEVVAYTSRWHNNDWVGYLGVHLTYKIYIGKQACPAYGSKE